MKGKLFFINSIGSVFQTVGLSLILFVLYRYLLETIGPDRLGVWSLILSTTSVAGVGKLGLTGSVLKFVAKYGAEKRYRRVTRIIETSFVSVSTAMGILLLFLFLLLRRLIDHVVDQGFIAEAHRILPPACVSLFIIMATEILFSGLDGLELIYLKNIILLLFSLVNLILCILLVPVYGLLGVAYARVLTNGATFFTALFTLNAHIPGNTLVLFRWERAAFREIWRYGFNFQLISIIRMALDPVTKSLMSHFGNLAMVGYYEMANRLVMQVRSVMVSANHPIIPVISGIADKKPEQVKSIYRENYALFIYISMPVYASLVILAPFISKIWLGSYQPVFIWILMVLTAGWALNSINVPAYYSFIGIGRLSFNLISSIVTAILNILLGFLLGTLFGGHGVVAGWVTALVIGSSVVYISYHRVYGIDLSELLPAKIALPLFACCLAAGAAFRLYHYDLHPITGGYRIFAFTFLSMLFLSVSAWFNPYRKSLTDRLLEWNLGRKKASHQL